jgi:hypothetical protein
MRNYAVTYRNIRTVTIETAVFTPTYTAMVENHVVSRLVGIQNNGNSIGPMRRIAQPKSHMLNENIMGILTDNKGSVSHCNSRRRSRLSGNGNIGTLKV